MIYVGIDVHKHKCHSALMNENGTILDELTFQNTTQGLSELIQRIQPLGEAKAVLESTGNLWIKTYDALEAATIQTTLSNPLKTGAIAEARIKTDKIDARTLAHLLRTNLVAASYVPNKETRMRRSLLRHRANLVKTRTEIKNRIHSLLDKYDLKSEFSDIFGKQGLEWLRGLQLPTIDKTILNSDLALLDSLETQIQNMNIEIAKLACNQEDAKLLMTMPGIDYYSAMIISSEIGDVKRFSTAEKLASWAGLAPSIRQSGSQTKRGHITKQGSRMLRWILVQSAQISHRSDPRFQHMYQRIAARRGNNKAIIAVAREMLTVAYYMLTRREEYRDMDMERYKEKLKRLERTANRGLQ
ncbi:MAG: IS110 family transposase [Candidatus Bathyarchaeia archaeon]|jgi:transposase